MLVGTLALIGCENAPGDGMVALRSAAINAATSEKVHAQSVSSMSFCITQLKFEADGGDAIADDDGDDVFETSIGLVNIGDGSTVVNWGNVGAPIGTSIKKVKVEVHRDPEVCGVEYSVEYNGLELSQDVEMTFTFPVAEAVEDGGTITFDLAQIASAFQSAYDAGDFSDGNITSYIENIEGGAEDNDEE